MCINKQQTVIIGGKQRNIDDCLVPIVTALNNGGVPTVACCCGHGNRWGNVILADGRELIMAPDFESARAFDKVHGRPIHDERRALLSLELATTTANNRYAAALKLAREYMDTNVPSHSVGDFIYQMEQRLNAEDGASHS